MTRTQAPSSLGHGESRGSNLAVHHSGEGRLCGTWPWNTWRWCKNPNHMGYTQGNRSSSGCLPLFPLQIFILHTWVQSFLQDGFKHMSRYQIFNKNMFGDKRLLRCKPTLVSPKQAIQPWQPRLYFQPEQEVVSCKPRVRKQGKDSSSFNWKADWQFVNDGAALSLFDTIIKKYK